MTKQCTPNHHVDPSPSHAEGAWCNNWGHCTADLTESRGQERFFPITSFEPQENNYHQPYLDDIRGPDTKDYWKKLAIHVLYDLQILGVDIKSIPDISNGALIDVDIYSREMADYS